MNIHKDCLFIVSIPRGNYSDNTNRFSDQLPLELARISAIRDCCVSKSVLSLVHKGIYTGNKPLNFILRLTQGFPYIIIIQLLLYCDYCYIWDERKQTRIRRARDSHVND